MSGALGSRRRRRFVIGGVQRERQRRLHRGLRQALEHAAVADGREDQVLVADAAFHTQQFDGLQHVVQIVGRLAHAHEHDLLHRATAARQHHLRDDLRAGELAQQAGAAGHAEHAAHRTADLGGHAHAVARQQHAFHRLAIRQRHQQAGRAILAGVLGMHPRQAAQFVEQARQLIAHAPAAESPRRAAVCCRASAPAPTPAARAPRGRAQRRDRADVVGVEGVAWRGGW